MAEKTRMETAIDAMRALQKDGSDPEKNAAIAEQIIKGILLNLGCTHLVHEWDKVKRY